ncbi:calcium/sodium antiporter [Flavobacteriaceae bacterium]|jgi:cation:H+ antiporter|nr:calcium/sodium antiporter [Flavobacteriaceae bacterium]MDA9622889.1 calcium/sodium antiporter [Flavobacteriaceae bacterium]MDB4148613.1 calcium/sodium antiporter [Flavobacteriaceae bacterium]MDC1336827.1 calcium/sodium antiporter [Flavobacteriaceae bacterium]MDC1456180.1 calcium/sodium antiporter [Flavobacteriaceae bacterium]|tara:strand:- start:3594 stop:4532 length:939 start_codon:yes stop_codon:yes gene_type:complete
MDFNTISLLIFGLTVLVIGGNLLLKAAVSISLRFGIPKLLIGMTVVSLATSAPELIVSIKSALKGSPDLAISNVLGSNIANLGLVLGITIVFSPINISKSIYKKEWPIMMFSAVYFLIVVLDGIISKIEGGILVCFLVMTISALIKLRDKDEVELENDSEDSFLKSLLILFFGGLFLYFGSEWFIDGAIMLANSFGISERIIGITVVSVGTSIPELVTSLVAVFNKEKSISLGNLLGSNIFNVFAVLGITSLVTPLTVIDQNIIDYDIYIMLFFAAIILPLIFFPKKLVLGRKEGVIILLLYTIYVYQLFFN